MEQNGVEEMMQLGGSGGTIQLALDALKEKKSSVDQMVDYCEGSYLDPDANKREVWLRTEEYLKDALGSVVIDIEDMAINLMTFVDAQADAVEKVTSDVVLAKTRLNRTREQSAATRLLALRKAAKETPARQKIVVLTGAERPTQCRPLPPRRRAPLKEKLRCIYVDEPEPLSHLSSDGGTAAGLGTGDSSSIAETSEIWGEYSPSSSKLGVSDLLSPSVHGGSPRSSKAGLSAPRGGSPRASVGGAADGRKERDRLDIAAAARKGVAPVVVPVMAPPPPARDSVVTNKRLSSSKAIVRPGGVGAPPPLLSRVKPGAPPPLLSQAKGAGRSSQSSSSTLADGMGKPLPPPPPPAPKPSPFSVPDSAQMSAPALPVPPPPPPPPPRSAASPPPPPPP
ncbi:unnamed protein product, partial [Hapterophycus canaliculatus]